MFTRIGLALIIVFSGWMLSVPVFSSPEKEAAAENAAMKWLALVDQSKYLASWNEALDIFKSAITADQWKRTIMSVRNPLGAVLDRQLKSRRYATELPGAPDGE